MSLATQVTALATRIATEIKTVRTEIAGRVATSRTISTTSPLTGGGDLSANRTLAVTTGTSSGTVALGDHTHSGYVPTTQRAAIGGGSSDSGSGTWAPDAAAYSVWRYVLTGNLAVSLPTGGVDAQTLRLWFLASGGDRVVTFNSSYEVTQAVPGRVFTVPDGTWASVLVEGRTTTWVLVTAYPQPTGTDVPTSRTISTTSPLTGGGDLSANRTLAVTTGTSSGTVATGDHTHSGDYVPTTQRGPIGGVQTLAYAATMAVDATLGVHFRCSVTTTGPTISVPTGGTDGQRILFELTASGGARTVNFNASYELGQNVTSRAVVIASGLIGYVQVINRSGTWRLLAVDDGT